MPAELVQRVSLFQLLRAIDVDLARKIRDERCPHCGRPLRRANHRRKPRGGLETIPEDYLPRASLCCGREGCRKRTLPPSCPFLGPRVHWGCVLLVVRALRQQRPDGARAGKLQRMFAIPRKTLMRWFAHFREEFPRSARWQLLRGRVPPSVDNRRLPGSLLGCFFLETGSAQGALVDCLRFLA
jgi:hypothetical protein